MSIIFKQWTNIYFQKARSVSRIFEKSTNFSHFQKMSGWPAVHDVCMAGRLTPGHTRTSASNQISRGNATDIQNWSEHSLYFFENGNMKNKRKNHYTSQSPFCVSYANALNTSLADVFPAVKFAIFYSSYIDFVYFSVVQMGFMSTSPNTLDSSSIAH